MRLLAKFRAYLNRPTKTSTGQFSEHAWFCDGYCPRCRKVTYGDLGPR